jgi:hypothetical protein
MRHPMRIGVATLGAIALCAAIASAQSKPQGWTVTANLGAQLTAGNADTTSGTAKARLDYNWLRTLFYIDGNAQWATAQKGKEGLPEFYAVGPLVPADSPCIGQCQVTDTRTVQRTAEHYDSAIGFERRVKEGFYITAESAWLRDTFSGVERKNDQRGGVGYMWLNPEKGDFKTAVLATYTDQKETVPKPGVEASFFGVRWLADYAVKFGTNKQSAFATKLAVDENLQTTDDLRATWDNALTVRMTDRVALQLGTKLAYRNSPALREIDLYPPPGPPTAKANGKVTTPFEKVDGSVNVALVITWSPRPPSQARPTP